MQINIENYDRFENRHIGPDEAETRKMLDVIGVKSLDALINETVPPSIQLKKPLNLPPAQDEQQFLKELKKVASNNRLYKSYIGMGYYGCYTPGVILRNIMENPGYYTQYTPYQAEIAQGRLEALLNYQTMIIDLTGMEIANASLLDEGTAAAEAMAMLHAVKSKEQGNTFFVSEDCFPQTIDIIKTRAIPLGIEVQTGKHQELEFSSSVFGTLLQYPANDGAIYDYSGFCEKAHAAGALVAVAADLLSLTLLTPPGEFGADVAIGTSQRFGVPMGYGGPHAAYIATKDEFKRQLPGRIIGVSVDAKGNRAYRMALQTREQHIRREKATSNICTAQVLLSIMAGMYAVYHGPEGLKRIALRVHGLTQSLDNGLKKLGYGCTHGNYFDTIRVKADSSPGLMELIRQHALADHINFRYFDDHSIGISLDETSNPEDVSKILEVFAKAANVSGHMRFEDISKDLKLNWSKKLIRESAYLTHRLQQTSFGA